MKDTVIPSSPFRLDLPVLDLDTVFLPSPPTQEPTSVPQDEELFDRETKFSSLPLINPSLENVDDNSPKKQKEKGKRSKGTAGSAKKKLKTESERPSGIFVGYAKLPCEVEEMTNKKSKVVKQECIDEFASVESMKEVERKLWLTHYDMLSEKLNEVVTEKCTGCQTDEANQLGHELCLLASAEEQVNLCFEEVYARINLEDVMNCWYKKVLEMPIALNPETLAIFRETVNPNDVTYKNRLKKWMI